MMHLPTLRIQSVDRIPLSLCPALCLKVTGSETHHMVQGKMCFGLDCSQALSHICTDAIMLIVPALLHIVDLYTVQDAL